jgi:hypothetical protein
MRFPRINRIRWDKPSREADEIEPSHKAEQVATFEQRAADAGAPASLQVGGFVADDDRVFRRDIEVGQRAQDHAWIWLSVRVVDPPESLDGRFGVERANVESVDLAAFDRKVLLHRLVKARDCGQIEVAAGYAGLVGGDDHQNASGIQLCNRPLGAGDPFQAVDLGDIAVIDDQHAVAIEEHRGPMRRYRLPARFDAQ